MNFKPLDPEKLQPLCKAVAGADSNDMLEFGTAIINLAAYLRDFVDLGAGEKQQETALATARQAFLQASKEREEWADAIRSVAPGCIASPAAAKNAIEELRYMHLKADAALVVALREKSVVEQERDALLATLREIREVLK